MSILGVVTGITTSLDCHCFCLKTFFVIKALLIKPDFELGTQLGLRITYMLNQLMILDVLFLS